MIPEEFQLTECPTSGTGVHRWIFGAACYCVDNGLTNEEAEPLIRAGMTRTPMPATEITDALRSARREERTPATIWDPKDEEKIQEIISGPMPADSLIINSDPHHPVWLRQVPYSFLDLLFPGDPLICMGQTSSCFDTRRLSEWKAYCTKQSLIVPSPMSALRGRTKLGHMSAHSLDNTGPRHYLVTEFDQGTFEEQYKLIFYLANDAPLVLICESGGKSLHAWFNVKDADPLKTLMFMQNAVSLGADPRTWLASQFVRLPDGTRFENKKRQTMIYFNTNKI
jgi:hypothetical protein